MEIFSNLVVFVVVFWVSSPIQTTLVGGNSNLVCGGIFERDVGKVQYHRENSNVDVDDATSSSVCVWIVKLLKTDGAGISLKLEDLDENSVVNLYAEGEPTNPVNPPITLNNSQISSSVELSGRIFIITLKTQVDVDQLKNPPTKFAISWSPLEQIRTLNTDWKTNDSKVLPVELISANYVSTDGGKGWDDFRHFNPRQKSVWILNTGRGIGGSLSAQVTVDFGSSCLSNLKSQGNLESGMRQKALCECSYFGLFEIEPSSGKLRSAIEMCGRPGSSMLTNLSTQLVVFMYPLDPNFGSGSGESVEISWERNMEGTNPATTELPTTPEPPIEASSCPNGTTIAPCRCGLYAKRVGIECIGTAVNQQSIENTFREIRQVNGIPEDRGIDIYMFRLWETELTQLDLAPFYASRMVDLDLVSNKLLTKFVTPGTGTGAENPHHLGSIHVTNFYLWVSPMNRQGFGETLRYFSNEMVRCDLYRLDLQDINTNEQGEIFPGLSAHRNLTDLAVQFSDITGCLNSDTWNFKALPGLKFIHLDRNHITGIGENVFRFDGGPFDGHLEISLQYNKLDETSFHPNSGIAQTGRNTTLYLNANKIATLPSQIFQTFLDANWSNSLELKGNPLICDERLSWIKSRREEFQPRVSNAFCTNDPDHTVFDSDLIP